MPTVEPKVITSLQLVKNLEKVQRSFTKQITGMFDPSYEARLHQLNLYSLQRRRDRYQIRLAQMWQQSGTLLFSSCHGIAEFLVDELQI